MDEILEIWKETKGNVSFQRIAFQPTKNIQVRFARRTLALKYRILYQII